MGVFLSARRVWEGFVGARGGEAGKENREDEGRSVMFPVKFNFL